MREVKSPEFNEGVRRLAQYRPFDEGGAGLNAVLTDLALSAAEINGGAFANLSVCRAAFNDLWDLEVEIGELRRVRECLVSEGRAEFVDGGFRLTDETRNTLQQRAQDTERVEDVALSQWEREARELRPDLTADDIDALRQDLAEWLSKIVARHGAEAALMLYPEDERAHQLFDHIETFGTHWLPKRSVAAMGVRDAALKRFVRQPSQEQRRFLANRLNTAFYLTVLTLDPAAGKLVEEKARGTRVYLDTNVLYSVLGMAPAEEVVATQRLLELSHEAGYQLAVTPWTVQELHKSIERARKNVVVHGQTFSTGLAQLMVKVTGEKGFTRSYWNAFLKEGVTSKDFFDRVSAFEDDLPGFGIEIISEGCARTDDRPELVCDYASLFERLLGVGKRDRNVIEHDAKHRLLVERLRHEGNARFSTARCWFLTLDTKLPTFASMMPEVGQDPPKLPFCISPSSWVQIVRAMTPRTENFDQMVVELLASPYVGYSGPVNQQAVREVVARMDQYEGASPELALAVVEDTALVEKVAKADGQEIAERVRAAYSSKATELQEQAFESARVAAEEQASREAAEKRARETLTAHQTEVRRREGVESDLDRMRRERVEENATFDQRLRDERTARETELSGEREKRAILEARLHDTGERRRKNRRAALGVGLAALGAIAVVVLVAWKLVASAESIVGVVVGGALLVAIGVNVAIGTKRGGVVLNVLGFLLGVAGIVLAVLLK